MRLRNLDLEDMISRMARKCDGDFSAPSVAAGGARVATRERFRNPAQRCSSIN